MKSDFDFVKDCFEDDNIRAPESINENEIMNKLKDKPKLKIYQKKSFKAFVSAAACFALVVGIISYASPWSNSKTGVISDGSSSVSSFNSYQQIRARVQKINAHNRFEEGFIHGFTYKYDSMMTEEVSSDTMDISAAAASHGETYVQVDGIDEADIIKNDGKYIYYAYDNNNVKIYEGEKVISSIKAPCSVYEMYVSGDRLVLCCAKDSYQIKEDIIQDYSYDCISNPEDTYIYVYDISDIEKPELIESFSQSGSYSTSRLIGNQLYVISNKFLYTCKSVRDCYIVTTKGDEKTTIPASSIYCGEGNKDTDFVTISGIDISQCTRTAEPKAFFGCGGNLYCNYENLYLAVWGEGNSTEIIKAELNADEISFTATATVEGYCLNQFSMDEQNGYFRIATSDDIGNNLYVFDKDLKKVGEVTHFAKDESIQAVKYIGDMAYVITYEFTDPLFVIDLSNPSKPDIKGSVEITGFSSQLVPVDDNTLLGIGYGEEWGIKLALFDISNPSAPAVLDSCSLSETDSQAQYNHKAILVNKDKGYFAIDCTEYNDETISSGALMIEINDGKIDTTKKLMIKDSDYSYSTRLTYIDDTVYVLDSEGGIYSFNY